MTMSKEKKNTTDSWQAPARHRFKLRRSSSCCWPEEGCTVGPQRRLSVLPSSGVLASQQWAVNKREGRRHLFMHNILFIFYLFRFKQKLPNNRCFLCFVECLFLSFNGKVAVRALNNIIDDGLLWYAKSFLIFFSILCIMLGLHYYVFLHSTSHCLIASRSLLDLVLSLFAHHLD